MPIGPYKDFSALLAHVKGGAKRGRGKIADPAAYAAAVARRINPDFDREAAEKKKEGK